MLTIGLLPFLYFQILEWEWHPPKLPQLSCVYPCNIVKRGCKGPCSINRMSQLTCLEAKPRSCIESKIFPNLLFCIIQFLLHFLPLVAEMAGVGILQSFVKALGLTLSYLPLQGLFIQLRLNFSNPACNVQLRSPAVALTCRQGLLLLIYFVL